MLRGLYVSGFHGETLLNLHPADTYVRCDDLWCITSYFNPAHYRTRRANYEVFADHLRRSAISLLTVECAFGADTFELPSAPDVLQVRSPRILWQKERLLNLALVHLPPHVKKVAWLDCDILFTNPEWAVQTSRLLEEYMVVQPFQLRVLLLRNDGMVNDQDPPWESFAYLWSKDVTHIYSGRHGTTGFAWAARRNLLEKHGLYDTFLSGIGDHLIAHAICGDWQGDCVRKAMRGPVTRLANANSRSSLTWRLGRRLTPAWLKRWLFDLPLFGRKNNALRRHFVRWAQAFYRDVQGRLGYTPGEILHLWHGASEDRGYDQAHLDLNKLGFDPTTDLRIGTSGCWEWASDKPALHQWAEELFRLRKEDGE
jgi:hypothetical protein